MSFWLQTNDILIKAAPKVRNLLRDVLCPLFRDQKYIKISIPAAEKKKSAILLRKNTFSCCHKPVFNRNSPFSNSLLLLRNM